jgi:hypothetical protein
MRAHGDLSSGIAVPSCGSLTTLGERARQEPSRLRPKERRPRFVAIVYEQVLYEAAASSGICRSAAWVAPTSAKNSQ